MLIWFDLRMIHLFIWLCWMMLLSIPAYYLILTLACLNFCSNVCVLIWTVPDWVYYVNNSSLICLVFHSLHYVMLMINNSSPSNIIVCTHLPKLSVVSEKVFYRRAEISKPVKKDFVVAKQKSKRGYKMSEKLPDVSCAALSKCLVSIHGLMEIRKLQTVSAELLLNKVFLDCPPMKGFDCVHACILGWSHKVLEVLGF